MHNAVKPGLGKIGVLVALEGSAETRRWNALGRQIGMHVAATQPEALDVDGVDPAALEREKAVLAEQARASGKPEAIIEKMVEGRIRKFYEEVVLLEQVCVHRRREPGEGGGQEAAKDRRRTLTGFARFQLGEGIDKPVGPTSPPRSRPRRAAHGLSRVAFRAMRPNRPWRPPRSRRRLSPPCDSELARGWGAAYRHPPAVTVP